MDHIKKEIESNNLKEVLTLLQEYSIKEESTKKQIDILKADVSALKQKVKTLEKVNVSLLKERNINVVKEYSAKLVSLMEKNKFDEFKETIEEHDYPVNEFITENFHDISHMNLLHYAIELDLIDFVKYLVKLDADVNLPDKKDKWTPLMYAIETRNGNIVKFLLDKSANVDYKDIDGFTPLAVSVDSRDKEMIKLILRSKPLIDNPKDILAMAEPYEDEEIIDIIKDHFGFQLILYEDKKDLQIIPSVNKQNN